MKFILPLILFYPYFLFAQDQLKPFKGKPIYPAWLLKVKDSYGSYANEVRHGALPANSSVTLLKYEKPEKGTEYGWYQVVFHDTVGFISEKSMLVAANDKALLVTTDSSYYNRALESAKADYKKEVEMESIALAKQKYTDSLTKLKTDKEINEYLKKVHAQKVLISTFDLIGSYYAGLDVTVINMDKSKIIKYVWIKIRPYNSVDDPVEPAKEVRGIGPIKSGERGTYSFETVFLSKVVSYYKLVSLKVQYMDKSFLSITDPETLKIINISALGLDNTENYNNSYGQ